MHNQFFYEVIQDKEDAPKVEGSFNLGMVVRTVEYEPGKIVVLMNDFHEEGGKRPRPNKNGKITMEAYKETISSQIYLNEVDSTRYKSTTLV